MKTLLLAIILAASLVLTMGCNSGTSPVTSSATAVPSGSTSSPISPSSTALPAVPSTAVTPQAHPTVQGTFIDGEGGGDAETLNWILAADASSFSYAGLTIDSLAGYDSDSNVVLYHMAKPVEVSAGGLTYTITIRSDLKWSDGQPVTADDYVYTMKNLMFSDWLNYPYASDWQETLDGKQVFVDVKVVDATTFTITRQTVDPEFADNNIYSLIPYPKHIAVKYEGDVKAFTEAPEFNNLSYTGNMGPYKYKDWVRNDKFLVDRNPDFYLGQQDGSPYFNQYEIKIFGTSAAAMAALQAGDITYTGIEPDQVAKYKALANIKVYTNPTSGYDLALLNQRNNGWEGLRNKSVRQAISMSISKQAYIDSIRFGFGDPAFSFIPKPSKWYVDEGVTKYGWGDLYNKDRAKQILLEAGYGTKKSDGSIAVQDKNGQPVKLTLVTTPGSNLSENTAYLIKQELAGIGVEVEIKLVPWETLLRQYVMNKVPGGDQEARYNNGDGAVSEQSWDMIIMALSTNVVAPSGSKVFFTTGGGLNYFGYSDPAVDQLFQRVTSKEALDTNVRKQIYSEISRKIADDQPAVFLDFPRGNAGIQANVVGPKEGFRMSWNYYKWSFAQP
jgi:peptide/nickel transport system substrate-binding protein